MKNYSKILFFSLIIPFTVSTNCTEVKQDAINKCTENNKYKKSNKEKDYDKYKVKFKKLYSIKNDIHNSLNNLKSKKYNEQYCNICYDMASKLIDYCYLIFIEHNELADSIKRGYRNISDSKQEKQAYKDARNIKIAVKYIRNQLKLIFVSKKKFVGLEMFIRQFTEMLFKEAENSLNRIKNEINKNNNIDKLSAIIFDELNFYIGETWRFHDLLCSICNPNNTNINKNNIKYKNNNIGNEVLYNEILPITDKIEALNKQIPDVNDLEAENYKKELN